MTTAKHRRTDVAAGIALIISALVWAWFIVVQLPSTNAAPDDLPQPDEYDIGTDIVHWPESMADFEESALTFTVAKRKRYYVKPSAVTCIAVPTIYDKNVPMTIYFGGSKIYVPISAHGIEVINERHRRLVEQRELDESKPKPEEN